MANKKRKLSGLGVLELSQAYNSLLNLRSSFLYEEVDIDAQVDKEAESNELFVIQLENVLDMIKSRLAGPKSFSCSSMTPDTLEQVLDITRSKDLKLKNDIAERTQKSILLGQDQYMSSDNMYRHLNMLENLVPKTSDASARLWIDTLLFRSATMVPAGKSMILNLEYGTLTPTNSTKLSGCIDYTAILTDNEDFDVVFTSTSTLNIKQQLPTGFFVIEAKPDGRFLDDHIPQAIAEMYACAKIMQKDIIRGALTNGRDWIFLIFYLNKDKKGGSFRRSATLRISQHRHLFDNAEVLKPEPDIIAGILSYWIENSFQDIGGDDWFQTGGSILDSAR